MTKEDTIDRINEFLSEEFEVEVGKLQPDAILKDTLELDSLDYVDLVVLLESNFSIKVKQEDFTSIRTFQDLYNYVIAKSQA
ncbi:MAG: acyl carrier protein [Bacteroidetes bacterium]|nr:acyl carrier protein [Bacteroidota bacterium]MBS1617318.1 acyl carrier protein [Bacteroidota bacterium]